MFTSEVPERVFDLYRSEETRWADVIAIEHANATLLFERAADDLTRLPRV